MKVLFDECVPWPMHRLLASHSCITVQAQGWSGIRNSELLKRAQDDFDLLITADQNILYQQNLAGATISILELSTNDLRRIMAAAVTIQNAVEEILPGQFVRLEIPSVTR